MLGIIYNATGLFKRLIAEENQETMKILLKSAFFIMLLSINAAFAADSADQDIKELKQALSKQLPQAAGAEISKTPIDGLFQVIASSKIMYMTKDARYVIDGDLIDLVERRNITEGVRSGTRKNLLDKLGEKNMLVYNPKGEAKHTITVFTDIYCPYCRRLHQEMDQYMAAGVKVRYIFLPFKGKKSFDDSVSVWCAEDQNAAMDKAKSGDEIESKTCDNPIERHRALATTLGIRGTPAIMYENGVMNPGYIPADKVIKQLESLGL